MKAQDLNSLLVFAIANRFPMLIKGSPGIGKTDIVHQAATEAGAELIISHPVVSDPTDYKGLPFAGDDGAAHFMPFGELQALIKAEKPTVFFLDDLGQAPASVQAAAMQLILARRINGHKVSEFVTFIAATNRKQDKAGVSGLLEPVKSRFASIVELEVDTDAWVQWAYSNNMPAELIAFIRFRPALLSKFEATKDITNSPSPRTVAAIGKLQTAGLPKAIEFDVFTGAAGEAFATEYKGFLKFYRELPDIAEIVLSPSKAPVSKEPAVQYAVSGLIAAKMNDTNIEALMTYLERLPAEIGVTSVRDAINRDRDLMKTKAFAKWATKNGNVIL